MLEFIFIKHAFFSLMLILIGISVTFFNPSNNVIPYKSALPPNTDSVLVYQNEIIYGNEKAILYFVNSLDSLNNIIIQQQLLIDSLRYVQSKIVSLNTLTVNNLSASISRLTHYIQSK
jgi:hypothetical protein